MTKLQLRLPPVAYSGFYDRKFTTKNIDRCIKNAKFDLI